MLKKSVAIWLFWGLSCSATLVHAEAANTQSVNDKQVITRNEQIKVTQAPDKNFVGEANFSRFPVMSSGGDIAPAIVNFSANSRTHWHIHQHGQYLIVAEGEGLVQEWGQPVEHIKKGDVIWCPPNVKHWHGASPNSAMTHIAISPVSNSMPNVTWLEPVSLPIAEGNK